jgi:hypothetical protein
MPFLFIIPEGMSVTNHLSIIIYHNITPSAFYDGIAAPRFASKFYIMYVSLFPL